MNKNFLNRVLSAALALSMTAAMAVPAYASGNAKYTHKDGSVHMIRWAEGIAEPNMEEEDQKGDFTAKQVTVEDSVFEVLEAEYKGSQGWFDLTQEPKPLKESDEENPEKETEAPELVYDSGYAAAAANLTVWWLQQNEEYLEAYLQSAPKQHKQLADPAKLTELQVAPASQMADESPIFKLFMEVFPEEAQPDHLLDFFLNGYSELNQKPNVPKKFKPNSQGGFFYPVFEKKLLTRRDEVNVQTLRDAIAKNDGAILKLQKGDKVRYVNLWGVETSEGGELSALFVTDSQDDLGMVRYEVLNGDKPQIAGMEITCLYALSLGEIQWEEYAPDTKPQNPEFPEEKPQEPEIIWGAPTYEWSADNKLCTAKRTAKNNADKTETEGAVVQKELTRAPSDNREGLMTYTAKFQSDWAETQVKTEEIPKTKLEWNAPTYEWDPSMRICRAKRTARGDASLTETAEVGVKARETREPTCLRKGETTFTADFEEDWAETQVKTLENIDKLTPNWGVTEYRWSEDHKKCTAIRVCKNETDGSHKEEIQGAVTYEQSRRPTTTKKGETTYTAKFNVDWADTQKAVVQDVPVSKTQWSEPVYTWSEDLKTCTAVRTDLSDKDRREIANAKVTSQMTKPSTCKEKGEITYTARFKKNWAGTQTRVEKTIPLLEPDWGETQYRWSEDHRSCTAVRVCRNEPGHEETAEAKITAKRTLAPSMLAKGETTYTAEFRVDWADTQTVAVKDIPQLQDLWYPPQYEWTEDLSKCVATRVNQTDKELVETAYAVVTSKKTKAPTNNMKGETTYTATFKEDWANTQKKVIANIPPIPTNPNGRPEPTQPPAWNAPTYEWSKDYSSCTATRTQRGNESNVDLSFGTVTKKEVKAATCGQPGEAVYTAKFKDIWAKTQTMTGKTPTLQHKLQKVEEVAATAAHAGMAAHYKCSECSKLFLDSEGKQEVTREQLKFSVPSVSPDYAIINGVPEKDHLIAVSAKKLADTLKDSPNALGVSVHVGSSSVSYDKKDVEAILKAAGDNDKLHLEMYKTDATDSGLTLDQIQTVDRNPAGVLYMVQLSYVMNGKDVPVTGLTGSQIMLPYSGTDAVRVYQVEEDGKLRELSGEYQDSFIRFRGENGLYMLAESRPSAEVPQKHESNLGMILWTSVLIVSGLLCLGFAGFYFYQKKLQQQEAMEENNFIVTDSSDISGEEMEEDVPYDPDFMSELDRVLQEDSQEVKPEEETTPEKQEKPAAPKSPVAPKAPMQEKPSIAQKTADAVNHTKHREE